MGFGLEVRGRCARVGGWGCQVQSALNSDGRRLNFFFCKMGILDVPTSQTGGSALSAGPSRWQGGARVCAGFRAREPARDHVGRWRRGRNPGSAARGPPGPLQLGRRRKWVLQPLQTSVSAGLLLVGCEHFPVPRLRPGTPTRVQDGEWRQESSPRLQRRLLGRSGPRTPAPGYLVPNAAAHTHFRARGGGGGGMHPLGKTITTTIL